jgi:predicted HNH restriction endonuclease
MNYGDNFTDVFNLDGSRTFCIEFELNCKDATESPAFISNFDNLFEEEIFDTVEGKKKYVRHKTRERNPEIVKVKKREFKKQHGSLFCEVCSFDFRETYGSRGDGFIECHHNIPLHEEENERITKTSDLSLLCSNCHRMIHRKKNWLTVEELKLLLEKQSSKSA